MKGWSCFCSMTLIDKMSLGVTTSIELYDLLIFVRGLGVKGST